MNSFRAPAKAIRTLWGRNTAEPDFAYVSGGLTDKNGNVGVYIDPVTGQLVTPGNVPIGGAFALVGSAAAAQPALSAPSPVQFTVGTFNITTPLTVSTIGQLVLGAGVGGAHYTEIVQTTSGDNGINFRVGTDVLTPGGGGLYFEGVENMQVASGNANTGVGLSVGDPAELTHNGDYFFGRKLYLTGWATGIQLSSMANVYLQGVYIENDPANPGTKGVQVTGGSPNSHLWMGVTVGNCTTAISWETGGLGNVLMPGDIGGCTTAIKTTGAPQLTIIGGNTESSVTGYVLDLASNTNVLCIGMGGEGQRATPAFNGNGGTATIQHMNTDIGLGANVMLTTGAGYGNTSAWGPRFDVDTTYDGSYVGPAVWKDIVFPSVLNSAIASKFSAAAGKYGAVAHIIRDSNGPGGLARQILSADGSTAALKYFASDVPDGTFTLSSGSATVVNASITANTVVVVTVKTVSGTRTGNPDIVPTPGTGFVATGAATDNGTYNYYCLQVA